MQLKEIYIPIRNELAEVEQLISDSLRNSKYRSIKEICDYILSSGGKRLRPALVLLSANASSSIAAPSKNKLINIAAAMELIHMASLVHDDVIDHSKLRHQRPTVNKYRGDDVAIAAGDYLYSTAFELISTCENMDVLRCISSATKAMCEGELLQVCERDNLDLLKERYIVIVKKKTAAFFAASCKVGVLLINHNKDLADALNEYGLNFGIAFQIIDDYLDLVGDEEKLGKNTGQDIQAGDVTLPMLNLLEAVPESEKEEIRALLASRRDGESLEKIKSKILNSKTTFETKKRTLSFVNQAKEKIEILSGSPYKDSLLNLADFILDRGFNGSSTV